MKRTIVTLVVLAGCGEDDAPGPAITIGMEVPIVEGINGTASVFDPLIGQSFGLSFVTDDTPPATHGMNSGCLFTELDLTSGAEAATGAMAGLVQMHLLDQLTETTLHVESCDQGRPFVTLDLHEGGPYEGFFSCFVEADDLRKDGDGYPRLPSVTAVDCHATIDDISAFRNFQSSPFMMTIAVDRVLP